MHGCTVWGRHPRLREWTSGERGGTGQTKTRPREAAAGTWGSSIPRLGRPQPGLAPAAWHDPSVSYLPGGHSGTLGGGWKSFSFWLGRQATGVQGRGPPLFPPPPSSPLPPRRPHPLTLGDGDGLEAVQLFEQAAPLCGVQAVDEVARALRRVQRLHGLLLGVGAQEPGPPGDPERGQPPAAAAPGRRAGRGGGGGGDGGGSRARRPQAAHRPAPQQRQQPGHDAGARPPRQPRGREGGRLPTRLDRGSGAGIGRAPPRPGSSRRSAPGRPAPCTRRARCAPSKAGPGPGKTFCAAAGPGARRSERASRASGAGWASVAGGRAGRACLIVQRG